MVPSLLWPRYFLGWFQCPSKTPWTLGIFQQLPQMRIYLDWASYYKSGGYQRFPWGCPNGRLPVDFSLACHPRRLGHSSQSNVQTFCALPSTRYACVLETKWHYFVVKEAFASEEWRSLLISLDQLDLIVTGKCIHEAQQLVSHCRVYQDIDPREWVAIFGACLI